MFFAMRFPKIACDAMRCAMRCDAIGTPGKNECITAICNLDDVDAWSSDDSSSGSSDDSYGDSYKPTQHTKYNGKYHTSKNKWNELILGC